MTLSLEPNLPVAGIVAACHESRFTKMCLTGRTNFSTAVKSCKRNLLTTTLQTGFEVQLLVRLNCVFFSLSESSRIVIFVWRCVQRVCVSGNVYNKSVLSNGHAIFFC